MLIGYPAQQPNVALQVQLSNELSEPGRILPASRDPQLELRPLPNQVRHTEQKGIQPLMKNIESAEVQQKISLVSRQREQLVRNSRMDQIDGGTGTRHLT